MAKRDGSDGGGENVITTDPFDAAVAAAGTGWNVGQAAPSTKYLQWKNGDPNDTKVVSKIEPGQSGTVLIAEGDVITQAIKDQL